MKTDHVPLDSILARVAMLERQNRRMKRMGSALGVALLALVSISWIAPYELATFEGKFYLRDRDGKFKGALLADPETGLGNLIIGTAIETEDTASGKRSLQPQPHISLGYRKDNKEPFLTLFDRTGRVRISLGVGNDGETFLETYDKNGALMWKARK